MYVRNVNSLLNKEGPIEHMVDVNIYYQGHRKRIDKCDRRIEVASDFGNAMASLLQS